MDAVNILSLTWESLQADGWKFLLLKLSHDTLL